MVEAVGAGDSACTVYVPGLGSEDVFRADEFAFQRPAEFGKSGCGTFRRFAFTWGVGLQREEMPAGEGRSQDEQANNEFVFGRQGGCLPSVYRLNGDKTASLPLRWWLS